MNVANQKGNDIIDQYRVTSLNLRERIDQLSRAQSKRESDPCSV